MTKKANHSDMVELVLSASYDIRRRLKIDDSSSTVSVSNEIDPRTYYLHNVLNEVDKAIFSVMSADDFLPANKDRLAPIEEDKQLDSKVLQSKIDELSLWRRKLTEILVDLIGFRRANNTCYYRHYYYLHKLDSKKKKQSDQKEFWDCNNKQLEQQIQDLTEKATQLTNKLRTDKSWYAKPKKQAITLKPDDARSRFVKILPQAKKHQKAILLSYQNSFGKPSESLHPKKIVDEKLKILRDVEHSIQGVHYLAMHVISAIKDLLRIHNVKGPLKQIANAIKNNPLPVHIFNLRTNPKISVGDFVITPRGPSRVVKVIKKKEFGYKSFRVEHLIASKSKIEIEEYIPEEVQLLAPKKKIYKKALQILQEAKPGIKVAPQEINKAMRKMVIDLWPRIQLEQQRTNH